jgi:hypothetical protein
LSDDGSGFVVLTMQDSVIEPIKLTPPIVLAHTRRSVLTVQDRGLRVVVQVVADDNHTHFAPFVMLLKNLNERNRDHGITKEQRDILALASIC